jgi:hypothetical protein
VWDGGLVSGLSEPRGEGATLFLLSCQETQRWREKFLGKKGLQVNDAVSSKKLVWLSAESCKSAASRRSELSEGTAQTVRTKEGIVITVTTSRLVLVD